MQPHVKFASPLFLLWKNIWISFDDSSYMHTINLIISYGIWGDQRSLSIILNIRGPQLVLIVAVFGGLHFLKCCDFGLNDWIYSFGEICTREKVVPTCTLCQTENAMNLPNIPVITETKSALTKKTTTSSFAIIISLSNSHNSMLKEKSHQQIIIK